MKRIVLLMLVFTASIFTTAMAPNDHQAYIQALTELRTAKWLIEHNDNKPLSTKEAQAVSKIDEAMSELKKAGIDDGKDAGNHPMTDAINDRRKELEKAMLWLDKAHADIDKEADMNFANGLKARVGKAVVDAREILKEATISAK